MAPPCTTFLVGELIHLPGALQGEDLAMAERRLCLQAPFLSGLQASDLGSMDLSIGLPNSLAAGFPKINDLGEIERALIKVWKPWSFYSPILEVTSHHFCHILFIRSW